MPRRTTIGVMGRGEGASETDVALAEELGERIAREGWVLLTGGRAAGVMAAAVRGAKRVPDSLAIGVLPTRAGGEAPELDVAIFTGMGDARNAINVLSSDVIVTCGEAGPGTSSEAALAIKHGRPLIMLRASEAAACFFTSLSPEVRLAATAAEVIELAREQLRRS